MSSPTHVDLVIRNAYLAEEDQTADIAIEGEKIAEVAQTVRRPGRDEIDAEGKLVSPGLVDCHMHMDKALTAEGERLPKYNEFPYAKERCISWGLEHFQKVSAQEIEEGVLKLAQMAVANGTLYIRTHVDVDSVVRTKAVEAVVAARRKLKGLVDIQIVAFAQSGFIRDQEAERWVNASLDLGADLIGGIDPASVNQDIEGELDAWFRVAKARRLNIDSHIHDAGTLGLYTLDRLAAKTLQNDYVGKVTVSHSFSLADASSEDLEYALPKFREAGLRFVTCFTSTPFTMPVRRFLLEGVTFGHGSDNVRDFWIRHGNADLLQGALIESFKLSLHTNQELSLLWRLITIESARILGIEKGYGVRAGNQADLVIFDAPSPQWAILTQARKRYVIKAGRVVARDGEVLPQFRVEVAPRAAGGR